MNLGRGSGANAAAGASVRSRLRARRSLAPLRQGGAFRNWFVRGLVLTLVTLLAGLTALYIAAPAHAANVFWDGGGVTENWSEGANWSTDAIPAPGDVAVFDATNTKNVTIDQGVNIVGISINSGYTGTITQSGANAVTLGASGYVQAAGTFVGGSGAITVNGPFTLSGGTSFTSTTGTLSAMAAWTHSGAVTFADNGGTVFIGGAAATIDVPTSETFNNLELNTAPATAVKTVASGDQLIVNGTLTLTDGVLTQTGSAPATGTISARGNITQASSTQAATGLATLFISGTGSQTLTGSATAAAGTLPPTTINKTSGSLTLAGTIRTGANWTNNTGGAATFSAGASSLHFFGGTISGSQTLNDVTFSAGAVKTIAAGTTLTVSGVTTFNNGAVNGPTGSLVATGDIAISGTGATGGTVPLTLSGSATQTFSSSVVPTAGTSLPAVTISKSGGAVNINNTVQTRNNWTFSSCTGCPAFGGTGTLQLSPAASLTVSGSHTLNNVVLDNGTTSMAAGTTLTTTGTLTLTNGFLNGTGTLAAEGNVIQASTFDGGAGNLRLSGGGSPTFTGNATVAGAADLPNVVIDKSAGTLLLSGTFKTSNGWNQTSGAGTVNAGTSTFAANGTSFTGSPVLNVLDIRAASTVTSGTTTAGSLTFTTGNLTATGGVLKVTGAVTGAGAASHVIGSLRKDVAAGASVTKTWEVGNGTEYEPVTVVFADATAGEVTARVNIGHHADLASSGLSTTKHVHDNWTLTNGGTGFSSYAATFTFASVENAANTALFRVSKRSGTWALQTAGTRTSTTTEATGITGSLGDFVVGELGDATPPVDSFSLRKGDGSGAIAPADGASYPGTGTVIFYKGNRTGGGSFKIRDTVTDADSGPASATFGALGGTAGGWTFTSSTVSTPSGGPYDSNTYTWPAGETAAPTTAVFSTDVANNNSTATTFTLTNDVTPPSGGSVTFTGLGGAETAYRTSLDIPVVLANGSDADSGVSTTTEVLDRLEAPLSSTGTPNGTCGTFVADGSFTALTNPSLTFTDTVSIESGKCYQYQYTVTDNVGNSRTYTSADVKVDASAPGTPLTVAESDPDSHVVGTTLFYRPGGGRSGSFTVDSAATDDQSGIEKVNFPALGTGFTGGGDDVAPTPYRGAYAWTDTASASGPQTVTATNNAGGTGTADFTLTIDSAAPSGGSVTFTGLLGTGTAYRNVASIPVVLANGGDGAGSGINATTESLQRQVADLTSTGILDGSCGLFANDGAATVDPDLSFTDSSGIVTGKCYRYLYTVTDNVGNSITYTSADVKVDTTVPAAPAQTVTENPSDPDQHASGSTLFFRPGADGGTFRVTSTATDAQSGIALLSFPSLVNVTGGGANDTTSPYEADYTWSVSTLAGDAGDKNVTATNNADGTSAAGTFALTADSTAPSGGSVTFTGLAGTGGVYRTTADIPVVLANGADGAGSGINESTESLQRLEAPLTSAGSTADGSCGIFVTDGSFTPLTSPSLSFTDTVSIESGKCYRYLYTVTDNVGNQVTYTSGDVKVDTSVPTTPVLTASDGGDPDSHVAGSTIFLRTDATPTASNGGTFTITAATTDPESGLEKVGFPSLSGSSISGGGDDTAPSPYSGAYTWTTSSTAVASATVTATNNAGGAAPEVFAVAIDNNDPTGSVSYYDGQSSIGTASVSFTNADGGSGLASVTIRRDAATITGATCGTFPGTYATLVATNPGASPLSDTLPGFGCYRYRIELTDNVGNTSTISPTFVYRYGAAGPLEVVEGDNPGRQHLAGQTLYVGDGGTFTITVPTGALPDGSTIDFPAVSATGLTGLAKNNDTAPFDSNTYTFTSAFSGSTALGVVLEAAGDGSSTETLTVTRDSTAPATTDNTGSLPAPEPSGWYLTGQTVTLSPTDGGSGVSATHYTTNGTTPTTGSASGTSVVLGDGQHTIKYFSIDNVGNEAGVTTAGTTVKIDTADPANSISRVAVSGNSFLNGANVYYRGAAAGSFQLSNAVSDATSGPAESAYPALGGTTTGWTHSGETITTPSGGPYASTSPFAWTAGTTSSPTLTVTSKDVAGRSKATTLTFVNDSTAPAGGAIVANGSGSDSYNNTGTVTISLTAFTDSGSGVASTTITRASAPLTGATCGAFTGADPVTLSGGNDAATLAGGNCYRYTSTATDNLGQTSTAATSASVKVDTTAPTAAIDSGPIGTTTATTATFMFSSNDASANFECRLDGAAFAACTSPKSYTGLAAGAHTVDIRAIDAAGNVGPVDSQSWTVASAGPNAAPTLASSTPDDGTTVSSISQFTLTATESVTWSSVTVTPDGGTATSPSCSGSGASTTCTYASSTAGAYTIRATASDGTTSVAVVTHFTIWSGSAGSDAPPVEFNAGGSTSAEATTSNGTATVTVPGGATTESIVVRIDPKPSTAPSGGFAVHTDTIEVNAFRTSDGQAITNFAKPIDIHFPNAPPDVVPLYSKDGSTWVPILSTFGHELPAGRADGYFRDTAGTVHKLTTHLTFFSLFRDTLDPTAPANLGGTIAADGLTLRWVPATDNAEVTGYVLYVDGEVAQVVGGSSTELKLGPFTAADTRTFTLRARDATGRIGPASASLRGVPSLAGLTLEQATPALAARGFALGSVTGSGGTIAAQAPAAPGLAIVGSAVNVTLGAGEIGQAKLVLRVASAKRISLAKRRWIAVRVTVSTPSQVTGELVDSRNRVVKRYAAKTVPSGASTVRFPLPAINARQAAMYKLQVRATTSGQRVGRTAKVLIVPGIPKARFTPLRRPIGVVVVDGSIKGLNLGSSFRVNYVVPSLAFDVVGLQPAFVEAAVIDLAAVDKGFVRSLRQVFPELRILVLAPTSGAAAQARGDGASIALVKPVPAARVAALLRRTLGR